MKSIVAPLSLFFALSAMAKLPDAITCTSNAQMPELIKFQVSEINGSRPLLTIQNAPFVDDYSEAGSFMLYFSNESNNAFTFMLAMKDIHELEKGFVNN